MFDWIITNWFLVAILIWAIGSEAIGMLPIKSNSWIQLIANTILRIFGRMTGRVQ